MNHYAQQPRKKCQICAEHKNVHLRPATEHGLKPIYLCGDCRDEDARLDAVFGPWASRRKQ